MEIEFTRNPARLTIEAAELLQRMKRVVQEGPGLFRSICGYMTPMRDAEWELRGTQKWPSGPRV